jgi:hypothetical protein
MMAITVADPYDLLNVYHATLMGIPEVVALVGGDLGNIRLLDREGDLSGEFENLRPPSILIYWDGITPSRFPARFRYGVGILLRVKPASRMFQALTQGQSSYTGNDGLPMLGSTIHPRFDPMELPTVERLQIPLGDRRVFECMVFKTGFMDRGSN